MSVAAPVRSRIYTSDDLLAMPSDERFELIRGELIPMPPSPGGEHGNSTQRLGARATVFAEDHDLGECFAAETGFLIARDPDTVLGPDWAFVAKGRLPGRITQKHVPVAPDIVLETRSPSDSRREVAFKIEMWLNAGVRLVWDLDPHAQTVAVHRAGAPAQVLGVNDTLSGEDILPGFELPLRRLFRDLAG